MLERFGDPVQIVGRESELNTLSEFVAADSFPRSLVLSGGAGIGKTTLWEAGVRRARERGLRVLSCRASGAETQLSFAALIDLLDGVGREDLSGLPGPQLTALEVALLRAETRGAPPERKAIAVGLLNALRALAARESLLIAIDDVQWLDSPSAEALVFAARRLDGSEGAFLLTRRVERVSELERALGPSLERLEVGALSLGAVRRLLSERLGISLPRYRLRQLVDATLGNPLFALELGRELVERGLPAIGEELPVPDAVEDLLGTRVGRLTDPSRRLLLAVALSGDLRVAQLARIADRDAVDDAVDAGLLVVDGDRVRASHPLLAAAARKRSRARVRQELHRDLATVITDEELRARHLALAADSPDEELAATVAAAAAGAAGRGARREAVELAAHALRLTPQTSPGRSERVLALAEHLETAGERQRVTDLLTPELDSLPPGRPRVRAWLLLLEGGAIASYDDHQRYFERALVESRGEHGLRAYVLAKRAIDTAAEGVERIHEAEEWALEALSAAPHEGADVERLALRGLGWARALRGRPIDDVCERFRAASGSAFNITDSPEPVAGLRLLWRGHIEQARTTFTRFLSLSDERGEAVSYAWLRLNMCELGLRAGEWEDVSRLLEEWAGSGDERLLILPTYQRCRALLAAGRGLPDEAARWATAALPDAQARGYRWQVLEALRARGLAAQLTHEPERAVESLHLVWEHAQREGVDDPGAFPVAPDLVEALTELGEVDRALAVAARLSELAEAQEHPWGLATAKRCHALVHIALHESEEAAVSDLEQAAAGYGELGLRFDRARTLLLVGRAQRRRRKWGGARRALEQAATAFDELNSPGWAEEARSELARVGARRPGVTGQLTPAEQRVVELAVDGLSNKEIARALFVAVNTVEVHLSHAYAKLGVRSRAQLARLRFPQA